MKHGGLDTQYYGDCEAHREFGTALHKAIEQLETSGNTDYDVELEPYIEQWQAFVEFQKERGFTVLKEWIEKPLYSQKYGFAGTADIPFIHENSISVLLVDVKSGVKSPLWEIQLSGYTQLLSEVGDPFPIAPRVIDRMCVQIKNDKWLPYVYDKRMHQAAFNILISALNISRWKQQKGI